MRVTSSPKCRGRPGRCLRSATRPSPFRRKRGGPSRRVPRSSASRSRIRNLGAGPSPAMTASLMNAQGQQGVLIDAGLFRVRQMPSGATERLSFVYEVVRHPDSQYHFDLTIGDTELGPSTTHRISFEQGGTGAAFGHVTPPTVNASAPLLETASTVHLTGTASCEGGLETSSSPWNHRSGSGFRIRSSTCPVRATRRMFRSS